MIGAGSAGLLLAGTLADRLVGSGIQDGYIKVILFSMVGMTPCAIALGFVESDTHAMVFLSVAIFFSAFQGGISGGAIQLMTPNRMRGQVMALYLLVANLIGLGLGPTVIALTTDYVFGYDAAIGKSIALCAAVLCPIAAFILWRSLSSINILLDEQAAA